jgi:hypothetical protein
MMGGVSPETCWAINKHWNNKFYYTVASCWLFLLNPLKYSEKSKAENVSGWRIELKTRFAQNYINKRNEHKYLDALMLKQVALLYRGSCKACHDHARWRRWRRRDVLNVAPFYRTAR